jgi:hypothetical protein
VVARSFDGTFHHGGEVRRLPTEARGQPAAERNRVGLRVQDAVEFAFLPVNRAVGLDEAVFVELQIQRRQFEQRPVQIAGHARFLQGEARQFDVAGFQLEGLTRRSGVAVDADRALHGAARARPRNFFEVGLDEELGGFPGEGTIEAECDGGGELGRGEGRGDVEGGQRQFAEIAVGENVRGKRRGFGVRRGVRRSVHREREGTFAPVEFGIAVNEGVGRAEFGAGRRQRPTRGGGGELSGQPALRGKNRGQLSGLIPERAIALEIRARPEELQLGVVVKGVT